MLMMMMMMMMLVLMMLMRVLLLLLYKERGSLERRRERWIVELLNCRRAREKSAVCSEQARNASHTNGVGEGYDLCVTA
jgi:hypothetical protein